VAAFFGKKRHGSDPFIDDGLKPCLVQMQIISAFAKRDLAGYICGDFVRINLAFRERGMQQPHPAVDIVPDGRRHNCAVQSQDRAYGHAEADMDISGGKDLSCRRQTSGVTKLTDCIRLQVYGLGGENGRIGYHIAPAFYPQAKRIYSNKFCGRFGHFFTFGLHAGRSGAMSRQWPG